MINKKYIDSMNKKMSRGRMGLFDDGGGLFYNGNKSYYRNCTRSKFTESLGEDKSGEILGNIEVEVRNNGVFSLEISDSSQILIHLDQFDIRILQKLRDYLNYAVAE